jgi:hypothetical protein
MNFLMLLKFWREGLLGLLVLVSCGLWAKNTWQNHIIAQLKIEVAQNQSLLQEAAIRTKEAITAQKKRDSAAEKAALIHQKKLDAINTESVPEQCEQGKDWAILKAIDFREDR